MFRKLLILLGTVTILTVILGLLPIHGETQIYENVLRLHVIANSDNARDQELKLLVRDAVLEKTEKLFSDCKTRDEAELAVKQNISSIQETALSVIKREGYDYPVSIELGVEEYPTKSYELCCFPAGEYLSLRIMIGSAAGQNWWCVLFPPLCVAGASGGADAFAEVGLNSEQYNVITQTQSTKYKVRFKLLEALGSAR